MIRKLCITVLCLGLAGYTRADDPPKQSQPAEPPEPAVPSSKPDSAKPQTDASIPSIDQDLLKSLEKQLAPPAEESPLLRVGRRMRDVQGRLVRRDPGEETRSVQTDIVKDLDELIEQLKKGGT